MTDILFRDLDLSRRLEQAKGLMGARFVETRKRLLGKEGYDGEWVSHEGACAIFDTIDSPLTQTFALGLFEPVSDTTLDFIEEFYQSKNAPVALEMSPYAGVDTYDLLCRRKYKPIELSNFLVKRIDETNSLTKSNFPDTEIILVTKETQSLWTQINVKGWSNEHPEISEFLKLVGKINEANEHTYCFLANFKGLPAAAGAVTIQNKVAVLNGATTLPQFRGHGLQSALIQERLKHAQALGCDLAAIAVEVGSNSQRNAERNEFTLAYTRTKWKLSNF